MAEIHHSFGSRYCHKQFHNNSPHARSGTIEEGPSRVQNADPSKVQSNHLIQPRKIYICTLHPQNVCTGEESSDPTRESPGRYTVWTLQSARRTTLPLESVSVGSLSAGYSVSTDPPQPSFATPSPRRERARPRAVTQTVLFDLQMTAF